MKMFFKYIGSFIVCVSMLLCVASCDILQISKDTETTEVATTPQSDSISFDTVNDLIIAVKRNPSTYADKKVTVKGTILKEKDYYTAVCDLSDISDLSYSSGFDFEAYLIYDKYKEYNYCIDIEFCDDFTYAVSSKGDYVELCGTVMVSNGELILGNCECEIIEFASERK